MSRKNFCFFLFREETEKFNQKLAFLRNMTILSAFYIKFATFPLFWKFSFYENSYFRTFLEALLSHSNSTANFKQFLLKNFQTFQSNNIHWIIKWQVNAKNARVECMIFHPYYWKWRKTINSGADSAFWKCFLILFFYELICKDIITLSWSLRKDDHIFRLVAEMARLTWFEAWLWY